MVVRFKKKVVKHRGSRTYGYGSAKKHRGKGSKGGKGKAGVGKKAGHRAIFFREKNHVLGKKGFKMPKASRNEFYTLSLKDLYYNLKDLQEKKIVEEKGGNYIFNLKSYKKLPVKLIFSLTDESKDFFESNKGIIKITKLTDKTKEYLEKNNWKIEIEA